MAITITTENLVQPAGELEANFFPDDNLNDLLDGWLADATARVEANGNIAAADQDAAATAWVYYRAYAYLARRLASMPSSTTLMQQSATISDGRVDHWEALATQQKAVYDQLATPAPTEMPKPVSASMTTQVTW